MAASSRHTGWRFDDANSRLDFYYQGTRVGHINASGDMTLSTGHITMGDGGTVTQATNKGTAVTLNTESGQITLDDAALGAAAEVSFTLTNSSIGAQDVVLVNHGSAGTAGAYLAQANSIADGSCKITVANLSAGSLGEAIVLHFAVIGGSSS
mgnify:CR=1 FL=1